MSAAERERSHVVGQAIAGGLGQGEASERLGIGARPFQRLVRAWRGEGDAGLVSRQRGQASHDRLAEGQRARIAGLLREKYPDFGPTLAAEKLLELDRIAVSRETIRRIQIGLGLWRSKRRRVRRVFSLRERRARHAGSMPSARHAGSMPSARHAGSMPSA